MWLMVAFEMPMTRRFRSETLVVVVPFMGVKYRTGLTLAALAFLIGCDSPHPEKNEPLPVFGGITTEFNLTRSRIKADQQLQVHVVFRNTGNTTRVFRFLDFEVDARIYSNGQLIEDRCPRGEVPLQSVAIKSGEKLETVAEVATPLCYKLAPGQYSIRFNYNLRVLEDDLRADYEKAYGEPPGGIVPWDGRDHPFTVVK